MKGGVEQSEDNSGRGKRHRRKQEDRKHTSGGVFIAIVGAVPSVVQNKKGAVRTIPGDDGCMAFRREVSVQ